MYFKQSQQILEEIHKAKKILVNLHRGPDPDSFGCAFAFRYFLCSLGNNVDVVLSSTSSVSSELLSFEDSKLIKMVNFSKFDFSKYDLFVIPDSSDWQQIVDDPNFNIPDLTTIVIDHHDSNLNFGKINLVEPNAASCAEVVYKFFEDIKFSFDRRVSELLLMGILGDTGVFQFSNDSEVLRIAADLIDKGANKTEIINKLYRTKKFEEVKMWGEVLTRFEIDEKNRMVWAALPYEIFQKYGRPSKLSSNIGTMFSCIIDGTDFGVIMIEVEKNVLNVSLRSRTNFDVSKLGEFLGGGGHKAAAGGIVKGLPFEKAVEKVLETARKYARDNK